MVAGEGGQFSSGMWLLRSYSALVDSPIPMSMKGALSELCDFRKRAQTLKREKCLRRQERTRRGGNGRLDLIRTHCVHV